MEERLAALKVSLIHQGFHVERKPVPGGSFEHCGWYAFRECVEWSELEPVNLFVEPSCLWNPDRPEARYEACEVYVYVRLSDEDGTSGKFAFYSVPFQKVMDPAFLTDELEARLMAARYAGLHPNKPGG